MEVRRVKDDQFPIQIVHNAGALCLTEQCAIELLSDLNKLLSKNSKRGDEDEKSKMHR